MSIAATQGVPTSFAAGDTVRFTVSDADYPPSAWACAFVLNNGVAAATSTTASESGDTYTVTISAATTATLAPGEWAWALVFTETATSERVTGEVGTLTVTPNPTATATPTFAQAQVTRCQTTIEALSARKSTSRGFNGQNSTDKDLATARADLVYWQAAVLREQAQAAALRGDFSSGLVASTFLPASDL